MIKSVSYIVLLFAVFVTAHGGPSRGFDQRSNNPRPNFPFPDGGFGGDNGFGPDASRLNGLFGVRDRFRDQLVSKLCANQTAAQLVLSKMQQLISTFQSNGSFAEVLENRAQEVAYIQDSSSAARLSSDCTGFITGLKQAKDADDAAMKARFQYYQIAAVAIMKTIGSLLGVNPSGANPFGVNPFGANPSGANPFEANQ